MQGVQNPSIVQGAKIPHASDPSNQNIRQKKSCVSIALKWTLKMAHIKVMKWWDGGVTVYKCVNILYTIHLHNVVCLLHFSISSAQFSSVSQSCPTLQLHGLQNPRLPCPSPTSRVYLNSRPLSWWCHPTTSSSVVPFSSCPQFLPASESFPMSHHLAWGGQSTRVSALASFFPKNTQDWSPLEWTSWISLQSKGFSRVFSNTTVQKHQFFGAQLSSQSNSHTHTWLQEKP